MAGIKFCDWNKNFIKSNDKIDDVKSFFLNSDYDEIAVVNSEQVPIGVLNRSYLNNYLCTGNDVVETLPLDTSFVLIEDTSHSLEQLILDGFEFDILVNADHKFNALISKRKLITFLLKEQDHFLQYILEDADIISINKSPTHMVYIFQNSLLIDVNDSKSMEHFKESIIGPFLQEAFESKFNSKSKEIAFLNKLFLTYCIPIYEKDFLSGVVCILFSKTKNIGIIRKINKLQLLYNEANTIIETSYDGITITDGQGIVIRVNKSHERITGSKPQEYLGKHVLELEEKGILMNSATAKVLKEKKPITVRQQVMNGNQIIVTGSPVFDSEGNIVRVVSNLRDVTELESLQEKLAETEKIRNKYQIELDHLRKQHLHYDKLVAESSAMKEVINTAKNIAEKDVTVLILGETGVGKEVIAKFIHQYSHRSDGPYIKVNCGAVHASLIESELFGYEDGAFTGGKKGGKHGLFEAAQGGTLFLDEIGEFPMDLQVKLLRVLQEKEIIRVGGNTQIPLDVRFLCATNRNLQEMVNDGSFREDLYYRLYVLPVYISPLRNRKDDILPLIHFFLKKFNQKYNCSKRLSAEARKTLLNYPWPGNIRELENMVERIVISYSSEVITNQHISALYVKPHQGYDVLGKPSVNVDEIIPLSRAIEETEKQLISQALMKYGNMGKAAKVLGVDRTTVLRKIKKYNLVYPSYKKG